MYDCKLSGEAVTMPMHRVPGLRPPHYKKFIQGVLESRTGAEELHPQDRFVVLDGGKSSDSTFLEPFKYETPEGRSKVIPKMRQNLMVVYDEAALVERRRFARGVCSLKQTEDAVLISRSGVGNNGGNRPRLHFKGTTSGTILTPCGLPLLSSIPKLTVRSKQVMYGPSARFAVAPEPGDLMEDDSRKRKEKSLDELEPAFYHSSLIELCEELLHVFGGKKFVACVVDMTPGVSTMGQACVRMKIPYLGFALTDAHLTHLNKWLFESLWSDAPQEGSSAYAEEIAFGSSSCLVMFRFPSFC